VDRSVGSNVSMPRDLRSVDDQNAAARTRGRRGGRPRVLDKARIRIAEAMLKDTVNYPIVGDVIDHLGIGRTAFYRYFPRIVSVNSAYLCVKEPVDPDQSGP
jgi:hypothetical protein